MAIKTKKTEETKELVITSLEVLRAREVAWGITFDLRVNGITIYGCTYRTKDDNGFIAFPSKKGKDDKYYNFAWFPVTAETLAEIEKLIEEKL